MSSTDKDPVELPGENPIYGSRFNWSKLVAIISNVLVVIMLMVSISLCIAFGVEYDQPKYFLLLVNLLLSTAVSFIFFFWYYRGTLAQGLIWYIVLQSLFLMFQCITTDVFAAYPTATGAPSRTTPFIPPITSTTPNGTNSSSSTSSSSSSSSSTSIYATEYVGPIPTPPP